MGIGESSSVGLDLGSLFGDEKGSNKRLRAHYEAIDLFGSKEPRGVVRGLRWFDVFFRVLKSWTQLLETLSE